MLVSNARALPRPCAAAAFVRILDAFAFEDPQGKASDSGSAVEPEVDAASGARSCSAHQCSTAEPRQRV
jgi:hypothetical protein